MYNINLINNIEVIVMVSVLSTIALWGPSTYYALRLASTLITPSYMVHRKLQDLCL